MKIIQGLCVPVLLLFLAAPSFAREILDLTKEGTVYVPAYSHVYHGNKQAEFLLNVSLSIRNVDLKQSITVTSVGYYNNNGKLVKEFLDAPKSLNPLGSFHVSVPEKDAAGGFGANFVVTWQSDQPVNPPMMESVMIGTASSQGVSFTSRGLTIKP